MRPRATFLIDRRPDGRVVVICRWCKWSTPSIPDQRVSREQAAHQCKPSPTKEKSMSATCNCCGHPVTEGLCCPTPPGSPWGTKCAEHEGAETSE